MKKNKKYSELIRLKTFEERFDYLKLNDRIGEQTFGYDRVFNQQFYRSEEWKRIRNYVINRDCARDLGVPGREIYKYVYIHHMNPITLKDIEESNELVWDPEYLICCTRQTHNAIHYGSKDSLQLDFKERTQNDTCPWR